MRRTLTLLATLVALLATAVPAAAITTAEATIDVHSTFSETGGGTFTADNALLCESGATSDVTIIAGNGRTITFHNLKTFTCADGSGTFTLRLQAQVKPCDANTRGVWSVADGTGEYDGLHGNGKLVGTYYPDDACSAEGIDDHLTGVLRLP